MKKHYLRKTAIACALATTWAAITTLAVAQEESFALEEVIVTARKREESLQDIAVSVTAITEQLTRSSVRNLQDIQDFVPNVTIDKTPGTQGASISIRGISFQETDKSLDAPIGVILDGVYLGVTAGQLLNNFDIERVEVLRGPQGTLFGKNTIGGAVNVIRSAPTKELGGELRIAAGDWDKQEVNGLINLPLTDKGGVKLYASSLQHDGYIKNNIIGDDIGAMDYKQYGATLAFDVTDNFDLSLTMERIDDDSEMGGAWANFNTPAEFACLTTLGIEIPGIPNSSAPIGTGCKDFDDESDKDHSSQNGRNTGEVTNDYANLTMNWMLGDWRLTSITGYLNREDSSRVEYDASRTEFLYVETATEYEQTSQEFRINGNLTESINITGGLYYWDSEYKQFQESFDMWYFFGFNESMGFGPGDISQDLNGEGTNTAYSAFASVDWTLTDRLLLTSVAAIPGKRKPLRGRAVITFSYPPAI